jgi:hypothetical protein
MASAKNNENKKSEGYGLSLLEAAKILPTPTASMVTYQDFVQAGFHSSLRPVYSEIKLPSMMNTPTASDYKNLTLPKSQLDRHSIVGDLLTTGITGQLSPLFVMEMMGFPPDWTLLPFLNGEQNLSKPEETL